jgi:hypothetical protein
VLANRRQIDAEDCCDFRIMRSFGGCFGIPSAIAGDSLPNGKSLATALRRLHKVGIAGHACGTESMTTTYEIDTSVLKALLPHFVRAEDSLARLDERALRSSIASGFSERRHFFDAIGAMWVAGELVHLEDLVLHDAHMDARAPSHELTIAHAILRARRRYGQAKDLGLQRSGHQRSDRDRRRAGAEHRNPRAPIPITTKRTMSPMHLISGAGGNRCRSGTFEPYARYLARLDRQVVVETAEAEPWTRTRLGLFDDEEWDEAARLREWRKAIVIADELPPTLGAAIAF